MINSFKNIGANVLKPTSNYIKKFDDSFYMGMHNHSYIEIMYAKAGNFIIEILPDENELSDIITVTVNQGSIIFLDSELFHRLKINENENAVIYNVELLPVSVEEYNPFNINDILPINYKQFLQLSNLSFLTNNDYTIVPDLSNIETAMHNLIFSLSKPANSLEDAISVQLALCSLFNEISKSIALLKDNNIFFTKKTFIYIKNHLSQNLTLDIIADAIGYHKSYLTSQFKKLTGKSIMQIVCTLRISKSLQLLRETNLSVEQIANRVGFSTYSQMFYSFKKHVGISPMECREHFINDEISHSSSKYQSKAIRVSLEDYIFNDEEFYSAFYKPEINSFADEALKNQGGINKNNKDKNNRIPTENNASRP